MVLICTRRENVSYLLWQPRMSLQYQLKSIRLKCVVRCYNNKHKRVVSITFRLIAVHPASTFFSSFVRLFFSVVAIRRNSIPYIENVAG